MLSRRLFLTLLSCSTALAVRAQTGPATMSYQGRLTDNTPQQNPVTGTIPMRFALYDAVTAGTQVWGEPVSGGTNVTLTGGVFSVTLGSLVPIPASAFNGPDRWLEITLNPGTPTQQTLVPRQKLSSVGYARIVTDAPSAGNYVFAYDTSIQLLPPDSSFLILTFGVNAQISGWTHSPGSLTFTTGESGLYRVRYRAALHWLDPGGYCNLRLLRNGIEVPGSNVAASCLDGAISGEALAVFSAGDTLQVQAAGHAYLEPAQGAGASSASVTLTVQRLQ